MEYNKIFTRQMVPMLLIFLLLALPSILKSNTHLGENMLLYGSIIMIAVIIRFFFLVRKPSSTAAGAIVMAIGIFANGAIKKFPVLDGSLGRVIAFILLLCWVFIAVSYFQSYLKNTFYEQHQNHPIKSFAIGTWIAGTSVVATVVYQRIPELNYFITVMVAFNCFLWGYYVLLTLRNFKVLFTTDMFKNAHGVLLLSCVSTQSLVVTFTIVFENAFLMVIGKYFIILGSVFYIISFIIILKRYIESIRKFDIDKDWFNTNCILHGAMSITGLASAISHLINPNIVLIIWLWVLTWFVIVEFIELLRAFKRIKKHGFLNGIVKYDVSQWSRNFTFGMLYAFTMNFDLSLISIHHKQLLYHVRDFILQYGGWIVLFILVYEIFLFFKENGTFQYVKPKLEKAN